MKILIYIMSLTFSFAQTGHSMQGAGAINFSMGGASTAQPIDLSGALFWNPATITQFNQPQFSLSAALFDASPNVYSKMPMQMGGFLEGNTDTEMDVSVLPTFSYLYTTNSDLAFGLSVFGVSGFGVDYPVDNNYPGDLQGNMNPNYDPTASTNPILTPQFAGGFGHIFSKYQLMQISITTAYQINNNLSIGVAPVLNYATLELEPLPITTPSMMQGYPYMDEAASAIGYGFHAGLFYKMDALNFGFTFKSSQSFDAFEIESDYLDIMGGGAAPKTKFTIDYPQIMSFGLGYSLEQFDFALDYRMVDYENTAGFDKTGFTSTGAIKGFGWKNIDVIAFGVQYKGIENLPVRFGYTKSSNPIDASNAFYSASAPAIIEHAIQFGLSYQMNTAMMVNLTYHTGLENDTKGQFFNPQFGEIPGSEIKTTMSTSNLLIGLSYRL